jgi:hypothetical protein
MSLYTRPQSALWYYEFRVGGKRYRGSTKTSDKARAAAFEVALRTNVEQAAAQARMHAAEVLQARRLDDVAQSWLAYSATALQDHKGNVSRVRKLFGREMRLMDQTWEEVDSGRFGLPLNTCIRDVTPELLAHLQGARAREGFSAGTIDRELSLVRSLVEHAGTLRDKAPESQPISPLEMVIKGRRAWKKITERRHSASGRKTTLAEQRQLWRAVGDALQVGRATRAADSDFRKWCKHTGFTMDSPTLAAAMWLAENWEAVGEAVPHVWSPVTLHRMYQSPPSSNCAPRHECRGE